MISKNSGSDEIEENQQNCFVVNYEIDKKKSDPKMSN